MNPEPLLPGFHLIPANYDKIGSTESGGFWSADPTAELLGLPKVGIRTKVSGAIRQAGYDAYIRSAPWRARCVPVLARAGGHCERCRRTSDVLEVHHLTYVRFRQELDTDLQALCLPCHARADVERRLVLAAAMEAKREGEDFDRFLESRHRGYADRLSINELLDAMDRFAERERWY